MCGISVFFLVCPLFPPVFTSSIFYPQWDVSINMRVPACPMNSTPPFFALSPPILWTTSIPHPPPLAIYTSFFSTTIFSLYFYFPCAYPYSLQSPIGFLSRQSFCLPFLSLKTFLFLFGRSFRRVLSRPVTYGLFLSPFACFIFPCPFFFFQIHSKPMNFSKGISPQDVIIDLFNPFLYSDPPRSSPPPPRFFLLFIYFFCSPPSFSFTWKRSTPLLSIVSFCISCSVTF